MRDFATRTSDRNRRGPPAWILGLLCGALGLWIVAQPPLAAQQKPKRANRLIKQVLESGAMGIIVPQVDNAEQALEVIHALVVEVAFANALTRLPVTLDSSEWYAGRSLIVLLCLAGLASYGFHASLGGRQLYPGFLADLVDRAEAEFR